MSKLNKKHKELIRFWLDNGEFKLDKTLAGDYT